MNVHKALTGLLVAQLAVAGLMWWPRGNTTSTQQAFLELEKDAITKVVITRKPYGDKGEEPVELVRQGDDWSLASAGGYPALPDKVGDVLDALADMRVRAPLATQASSHNQLKVGDQEYSKKVEVHVGDTVHAFRMGAAASNTSHVRREGEDEVYAVGVSAWTVSDNGRNYWEAQYVELEVDDLSSLTVTNDNGTLTFLKLDSGWDLLEVPEGGLLDQGEVDTFMRKVTKVRMNEPVAADAAPEHGLDGGARIEWSLGEAASTGEGSSYRVGADDESWTYVQAQDDFVVKVSKAAVETVKTASLDDFLQSFEDEG